MGYYIFLTSGFHSNICSICSYYVTTLYSTVLITHFNLKFFLVFCVMIFFVCFFIFFYLTTIVGPVGSSC